MICLVHKNPFLKFRKYKNFVTSHNLIDDFSTIFLYRKMSKYKTFARPYFHLLVYYFNYCYNYSNF